MIKAKEGNLNSGTTFISASNFCGPSSQQNGWKKTKFVFIERSPNMLHILTPKPSKFLINHWRKTMSRLEWVLSLKTKYTREQRRRRWRFRERKRKRVCKWSQHTPLPDWGTNASNGKWFIAGIFRATQSPGNVALLFLPLHTPTT